VEGQIYFDCDLTVMHTQSKARYFSKAALADLLLEKVHSGAIPDNWDDCHELCQKAVNKAGFPLNSRDAHKPM